MNVDIEILRKYNRPGPRYTSYPTAPVFKRDFSPDDFQKEILLTNSEDASRDISLYFHFPFCDTLCYFCGCTTMVTHDRERIDEYLEYMKKEIDLVSGRLSPQRKVTQIHWGGGTPTHLTPDEIIDIAEHIKSSFRIDPEVEMSVEIDPRELTQKHLGTLRHVGFNRISIGVQDFNPKVQRAVNRVQPEEMTLQVIKWAEALEFDSINIDLMYGLPLQTLESFEVTLAKVIQLHPDRLAVFNYAHVPWMKPHQKLIHPEDLPSPEVKLNMLKMTIETLTAHGYAYIGMDHFAKQYDELATAQSEQSLYRNFQGYSTKAGTDLYGFGMSSISQFENIYAQNEKTLPDYYKAIKEGKLATHVGYRMTEDDHIRKHVIMRLMCDLKLSIPDVEQRFGISFKKYFSSSIHDLHEFEVDGLVRISSDAIEVTEPGRLVLRNIAMCFDAYLQSLDETIPLFSKTV